MIDDLGMLELHRRGAGDGVQRLAGGIGDQVQIDATVGHGAEDNGDRGDCHHIVGFPYRKPGTTRTVTGTVEEFT